ncbi:MAG: gtrA-like family protein [Polaromonas sp.]|nr:gtrA-like family protein [Polaromonas sp.]
MAKQLIRFLLTGGLATVVQYAVLGVCMQMLEWSALLASCTGYLAGSVLSYLINYYFTFSSGRPHHQAAPLFYIMVAVGLVINSSVMAVLAGSLGWNPWLSQLIATMLALIWNFVAARLWVFRLN